MHSIVLFIFLYPFRGLFCRKRSRVRFSVHPMCYYFFQPLFFSLSSMMRSDGACAETTLRRRIGSMIQYSVKFFSLKRPFFKKFFQKDILNLTFTEFCNIIQVKRVKNTVYCINFKDMIVQNSVFVNRNLSLTRCKNGNLRKNQRIV